MGLIDSLKGLVGKDKSVANEAAGGIEAALDKAGNIGEKTGGKYSDQLREPVPDEDDSSE
ncbi:hypothetical protein ACMATS_06120 [Streptoverticillium reticulum]|uniref:hypothetical protein n=1 Tax=Streptoverticillium reticulum TaxID=1433415 RepID=UPI0039BF3E50